MYYRITDQSDLFLMSRIVLYTENNKVAQVYFSFDMDQLVQWGEEWIKTAPNNTYPPFIVRSEYFSGEYTVRDMRNFDHNQYLYTPCIKSGNGKDSYKKWETAHNRARLLSHIIGSVSA